jgi:hypothetical protein
VLLEDLIAIDEFFVDDVQLSDKRNLHVLKDVFDLSFEVVEVSHDSLLLSFDFLFEVFEVVLLFTK